MTSPSFEFPVFEAEEEEDEEISKEISRLLQQKEEAIQPYNEPLEIINLGSDGNRKEVKIGASPRTEKQVRGFLGRLNYISRFIYLRTPTCAPIFKLLRKNQSCVWTDDCQK